MHFNVMVLICFSICFSGGFVFSKVGLKARFIVLGEQDDCVVIKPLAPRVAVCLLRADATKDKQPFHSRAFPFFLFVMLSIFLRNFRMTEASACPTRSRDASSRLLWINANAVPEFPLMSFFFHSTLSFDISSQNNSTKWNL